MRKGLKDKRSECLCSLKSVVQQRQTRGRSIESESQWMGNLRVRDDVLAAEDAPGQGELHDGAFWTEAARRVARTRARRRVLV